MAACSMITSKQSFKAFAISTVAPCRMGNACSAAILTPTARTEEEEQQRPIKLSPRVGHALCPVHGHRVRRADGQVVQQAEPQAAVRVVGACHNAPRPRVVPRRPHRAECVAHLARRQVPKRPGSSSCKRRQGAPVPSECSGRRRQAILHMPPQDWGLSCALHCIPVNRLLHD